MPESAAPSPLVSVVIPTFNRRQDALGAVANVLAEDVGPLEVLVVDDGSQDGTAEAVAAAYGADPRVRVLRQANAGCGPARNAGFDAARAPYVALLDSDDRCLPGRLRKQREALERHPEAGLCVTDCWELRPGGRRVRMGEHHAFVWPTSLAAMFQGAWAVPSGWMLRTAVARRIRFDPVMRYQEDIDFLFRLHEAGVGVVALGEPLLDYLVAPTAAPQEAPKALSAHKPQMADYGLWAYRRAWQRLPAEDRRRVRLPTRILRLLVAHGEQTGRYSRARRHLLAWWRQRPGRIKLLLRWVKNLRPDRPNLAHSPLGDLDLE